MEDKIDKPEKAVILAAGRGSRLKSLTDDKPKCLNMIANKPLLQWQINSLRKGGIKDIVLVTGYRSELFDKWKNVRRIQNPEWEETNMLKSLLCAKSEFFESIIVSYSDIIYHWDIIKKLREYPSDIALSYDKDWLKLWSERFSDPLKEAETFKINEENIVTEIGKKPGDITEIQGQYMGLMKFTPQALSWIIKWTETRKNDISKTDMTTTLQGLIDEGYPVYGLGISGGWCEIDTPKDLAVAEKLLQKGILREG